MAKTILFGLKNRVYAGKPVNLNPRKHERKNMPDEQVCDLILDIALQPADLKGADGLYPIAIDEAGHAVPGDKHTFEKSLQNDGYAVELTLNGKARVLHPKHGIALKQFKLDSDKTTNMPITVGRFSVKGLPAAEGGRNWLLAGVEGLSVKFVPKDNGMKAIEAKEARAADSEVQVADGQTSIEEPTDG